MRRIFQGLALIVSIGLLTFLACRAQTPPAQAPSNANAAGSASSGNPAPVDAAATAEPVYLPASKAGPVFVAPPQAPR